jgi:hypothetical protein
MQSFELSRGRSRLDVEQLRGSVAVVRLAPHQISYQPGGSFKAFETGSFFRHDPPRIVGSCADLKKDSRLRSRTIEFSLMVGHALASGRQPARPTRGDLHVRQKDVSSR